MQLNRQCVLEQNFAITDNGVQVVQELMDQSKGSVLLMAAEVGFYD